MPTKMSTKAKIAGYGLAAAVLAIVLIAVSAFVPSLMPRTTAPALSTLYVMLSDPPIVPPGTSSLNLTYSSVSVHIVLQNGTSTWISVNASGTVDLLRLSQFNESRVIAAASVPTNATVDKIMLTVQSITITVDGVSYSVTPLSRQLVVSITAPQGVKDSAAVLLDLNPTVVEIAAANATGAPTKFFAMVPSAVAVIKVGLKSLQLGQHIKLSSEDRDDLDEARQRASNVVIKSATLQVKGNETKLSVTLKNTGSSNATIFGIVVHGEFNATLYLPSGPCKGSEGQGEEQEHGGSSHGTSCANEERIKEMEHPRSLPFKINASSNALIPLLGEDDHEGRNASLLVLGPGQEVTLTFQGIIQLGHEMDEEHEGGGPMPTMIITPIKGLTYEIRLMGEGFETYSVNATAG
jgi:hypothetical protein